MVGVWQILAGKMRAPLEPLEWKLKPGLLFILVFSTNNRGSFQIAPSERAQFGPWKPLCSESQVAATLTFECYLI